MKELENIGMPYRETDEYISNLVSKATEEAIHRQPAHRHTVMKIMAAAAVILLVAGGVFIYYNKAFVHQEQVAQSQASPVDAFLGSLTVEEAQSLTYYEVEEIKY